MIVHVFISNTQFHKDFILLVVSKVVEKLIIFLRTLVAFPPARIYPLHGIFGSHLTNAIS